MGRRRRPRSRKFLCHLVQTSSWGVAMQAQPLWQGTWCEYAKHIDIIEGRRTHFELGELEPTVRVSVPSRDKSSDRWTLTCMPLSHRRRSFCTKTEHISVRKAWMVVYRKRGEPPTDGNTPPECAHPRVRKVAGSATAPAATRPRRRPRALCCSCSPGRRQ